MKLSHIAGNTYYFDLPSSVGIYIFADRSCLLIDSSGDIKSTRLVISTLRKIGLTVCGIINTHSHADHCTGNRLIQDTFDCKIYASEVEAALIENPILGVYGLYSANPLKVLENKYLLAQASRVTNTINPGELIINNTRFEIIDLRGHSFAHIGVVTPDEVMFAGDSLISLSILKEYSFLYLVDVAAQLKTLQYLESVRGKEILLSHGGLVADLHKTINGNQLLLNNIRDFILNMLSIEASREQIIRAVIHHFNIPMNRIQYYLIASSVSAFLSYLCNNKKTRSYMESGLLKFKKIG